MTKIVAPLFTFAVSAILAGTVVWATDNPWQWMSDMHGITHGPASPDAGPAATTASGTCAIQGSGAFDAMNNDCHGTYGGDTGQLVPFSFNVTSLSNCTTACYNDITASRTTLSPTLCHPGARVINGGCTITPPAPIPCNLTGSAIFTPAVTTGANPQPQHCDYTLSGNNGIAGKYTTIYVTSATSCLQVCTNAEPAQQLDLCKQPASITINKCSVTTNGGGGGGGGSGGGGSGGGGSGLTQIRGVYTYNATRFQCVVNWNVVINNMWKTGSRTFNDVPNQAACVNACTYSPYGMVTDPCKGTVTK